MEFVFAILIVALAAGGLAVGLVFAGRPPQGSCGGLACINGVRCEGCPNHKRDAGEANDA